MKTLIAATILATLSSTAFASAELPQDTIPGYGVELVQANSGRNVIAYSNEVRAESMADTIPGYGVEAGKGSSTLASSGSVLSQPEIGSAEFDFFQINANR